MRVDQNQYPKCWYRKTWVSWLLFPISVLYSWFVSLHVARQGYRIDAPVICLGGLTMGGVGKTPMAQKIAREARAQGYQVAILMRGYGRKRTGALNVALEEHNHHDVGDEALCHAREFDVWVGSSRRQIAKAARETGTDFFVLDDGLQHHLLHKDVSVLMLGDDSSLGNGHVFPAGPLRESYKRIWKRIDCCIHEPKAKLPQSWHGMRSQMRPKNFGDSMYSASWPYDSVLVFCGIARPQRLLQALRRHKIRIASRYIFPDHYDYPRAWLEDRLQEAQRDKLTIVTTQKDFVRLPLDIRKHIKVVPYDIDVSPTSLTSELISLARLRFMLRDPQGYRRLRRVQDKRKAHALL